MVHFGVCPTKQHTVILHSPALRSRASAPFSLLHPFPYLSIDRQHLLPRPLDDDVPTRGRLQSSIAITTASAVARGPGGMRG